MTPMSDSKHNLGICWAILALLLIPLAAPARGAEDYGALLHSMAARQPELEAHLARIDLSVNALTLGTQLFLTGRLLKWFGVRLTLGILPSVSATACPCGIEWRVVSG